MCCFGGGTEGAGGDAMWDALDAEARARAVLNCEHPANLSGPSLGGNPLKLVGVPRGPELREVLADNKLEKPS